MDDPNNGAWSVPEYLQPLYQMWSVLGVTYEQVFILHRLAEVKAEGLDDKPANTVLDAFLDSPIDMDEHVAREEGESFLNVHDTLETVEKLLGLLVKAVATRVTEMDALPPWWDETYDLVEDRPIMAWEIMYRQMIEEFGDGTEGDL